MNGEMKMLTSFALIFIGGMLLGYVFKKIEFPMLVGMLLVGILIGPFAFNLLDEKILYISSDLRQFALIVILLRAGLNLDMTELKQIGRPALLLSFIPACFEIIAIILIAPIIFSISYLEAAILGCVIAAVSPAIIVPSMLFLKEKRLGTDKKIPQMIMAAASVDDIFVIMLFTTFTTLASTNTFNMMSIISIPLSIVLGISIGWLIGVFFSKFIHHYHLRDTSKLLLILSIAFILIYLETWITAYSGLLAIMTFGMAICCKQKKVAERLSIKFSKLWIAAELLLFVLVGATIDINYALMMGISALLLLIFSLMIRMLGVYISVSHTPLSTKERLFCCVAYIPKATVQAAIGSIPLAMGLNCGSLVLTVAIVAILFTAPLGAFLIDLTQNKWLNLPTT